ncbi:hypothetical protein VKT23_010209 [Stygiomarasmius scandens]|uniref:Uncharacterized protein n=1 Tax=Marasmiellus scandens TaxID=2682957 RepID=A0ABR1JCB6_9AGAR
MDQRQLIPAYFGVAESWNIILIISRFPFWPGWNLLQLMHSCRYTVPEGGDAPTSTDGTLLPSAGGTSSASDPTSSDPTPHTLSKEKHLSIIIAGTFGSVLVVFMLFTCLGFMWVYRRRRRAAKHVAAGFGRTLHKDGLRGVSPFTLIHPESTTAKGIQTSNILDVSNEGEPIEAVPVDVSAQVYESIRASRLKRELDRSDHATGNANTGMRDIGLATLAAQASSRSSRIVVPHISWEDGTQHDGNETEPDFVQYMDIVPGMQGSSESQAVGHENSDLPPEYTSVQES